MKGPRACGGCATPFQEEVSACPSCGAPPGRALRSWNTASSSITAVEWKDGVRVVKRLKDLHDERKCARIEREAEVLSVLASQLPSKTVPELLAVARGVLVTRFVAGANMQEALRRPAPQAARALAAAGRTLAALQGVDWSTLSMRPEPGGLIPTLKLSRSLFRPGRSKPRKMPATSSHRNRSSCTATTCPATGFGTESGSAWLISASCALGALSSIPRSRGLGCAFSEVAFALPSGGGSRHSSLAPRGPHRAWRGEPTRS